jgi:hypothetical protein
MPATLGWLARDETLRAALVAALVAVPLALFGPPGGDAPAHFYRTELVRDGVFVWDGFWFAGHYPLAAYSLLYYFPAAVVGNVPLVVAAIVGASALFARLARHEWGANASWPAVAFAVAAVGPLFTGTYPYAVGVASALAALRAAQLGRTWLASACIVLTVGFSPLAFLFLVLALVAAALVRRRLDRRTVAIGAALLVAAALQLAALLLFPHDATYPFFRPGEFAAVLLTALAGAALALRNPRGRLLAWFFGLWALVSVVAFAAPSPLGENVTRLRGVLVVLMLLAVVLAGFRPRWLAFPALGVAVVYTLVPYLVMIPFRVDGRSWQESFWTPVIAFLDRAETSQHRVEVVPTGDHWESYWIPRAGFPIARGWYRQLDYEQNRFFYASTLDPAAYQAWLRRLAVRYVLLPDTQIGRAGEEREADLLRSGRSGLQIVMKTPDWTVYEVLDAPPLLTGPAAASITSYEHDSVAGSTGAPGRYRLAVRFTPYWRVAVGDLCTAESADGMTELYVRRAGPFRLDISLAERGSAVCGPDTGG